MGLLKSFVRVIGLAGLISCLSLNLDVIIELGACAECITSGLVAAVSFQTP